MFGGRGGLKAALDFFGGRVRHRCALAPIPETIVAVRNLGLPADASERIFSSNAKRLLSL